MLRRAPPGGRAARWRPSRERTLTSTLPRRRPAPPTPPTPPPDDALALIAAFRAPSLDVVGLTTTFGNVETVQATRNAFVVLQLVGRRVPVAEGAHRALSGAPHRAADFVHGKDGLGDTGEIDDAPGEKEARDAADFIAETARASPGAVSLLALGPLTNVARALARADDVATNLAEIVVLGGAFFRNGNVSPAAEANIRADPAAADAVFASRAKVRVVGLDVTHACRLTAGELAGLAAAGGKAGAFAARVSKFYLQYHRAAYSMDAVFLHDPTALAALIDPALFTWAEGAVVVAPDGVLAGATVMDQGEKVWAAQKNAATNPWVGRTPALVATGVDSAGVVALVLGLLGGA